MDDSLLGDEFELFSLYGRGGGRDMTVFCINGLLNLTRERKVCSLLV